MRPFCNFMSLQIFSKGIFFATIHQVSSIQKHIPSILDIHRKSSSESIFSQVCQCLGGWWGSGQPDPHHLLRVLLLPLQEEGGWEEEQRARRSHWEERHWREDLIWKLCFDRKFQYVLKDFHSAGYPVPFIQSVLQFRVYHSFGIFYQGAENDCSVKIWFLSC